MNGSAVQSDPMFLFSVKLCAAIKKHECLYDSKSASSKIITPEREAAWQASSEEVGETVENCKWRWKNMRRSFVRALRKGNNNKYYLHEYMEYLIPYLLGGNEKDENPNETLDTKPNIDSSNTGLLQVDGKSDENKNENLAEMLNVGEEKNVGLEEKNVGVEEKNVEVEAKNVGVEDKNAESDSDTTSADESHVLTTVNQNPDESLLEAVTEKQHQLESEALKTVTDTQNTDANHVGDFLIKEIDESGTNVDEDMYSAENMTSRSRYRRACKRGLDAEILNELTTDKQEEKRPRRLAERRKTVTATSVEEFSNKRRSLPNLPAKKLEPKVNKTKSSKATSSKVKFSQLPPVQIYAPTYLDTSINIDQPVNTSLGIDALEVIPNISSSIENIEQIGKVATFTDTVYDQSPTKNNAYEKPQMFDSSTITDFQTRDSSTQYDNEEESLDFDNLFINSLKPQLKLMNGRQKMNFKRKVFQSLMEVFDDASNFPNTEEYIMLPPGGAPRFDTTTTGELRLMRELVSIVQAAKTTPEIVNATEKIQVNPVIEKPLTPQTPELLQSPSPMLLSPTLDEEDISFTTEAITEYDNSALPRSLTEILARRDDDEVLGLPRRVIHKVVKVAGSNGSTIVTHNGDKRRVYRIYPKTGVAVDANRIGSKNLGNIGTFYVNQPKTDNTNTTTDNPKSTNKTNTGTPNITFRSVNKTPNISSVSFTPTNANNKTPIFSTANRTPNTSANTGTPILNQATGLFTYPSVPSVLSASSKTPPSTNNKPSTLHSTNYTAAARTPAPRTAENPDGILLKTTNNKPSTSPMLPPSSSTIYSTNSTAALRTPAPRTAENPNGILIKTKKTIIQRTPIANTIYSTNPTAALRTPAPRTAENPDGILIKSQNAIMQRRYSICGPAPSRSSPLPMLPKYQPKPVIQKVSFSPNGNPIKSAVSQIQMSKPVSLNTSTTNSPTSNKALFFGSKSNVTSTTTSNVQQTNNKGIIQVKSGTTESPTITTTEKESASVLPSQQAQDIPILQTAGTIAADTFGDPLFVKPLIKSEPLD